MNGTLQLRFIASTIKPIRKFAILYCHYKVCQQRLPNFLFEHITKDYNRHSPKVDNPSGASGTLSTNYNYPFEKAYYRV